MRNCLVVITLTNPGSLIIAVLRGSFLLYIRYLINGRVAREAGALGEKGFNMRVMAFDSRWDELFGEFLHLQVLMI